MAHAMPQVEGVEHRFLRVGETSFHVALAGEPDADPVLLVHDWPQHWYAWRDVIPKLAARHRVIALDLRGFGWTDIAWTGFGTEGLVDDALGVLDALEVDRVRWLGHGWGGWIGLAAALRDPRRVERLCALGPLPPWLRPTPASLAALFRLRARLAVATPLLGPRLCRVGGFVAATVRRSAGDRTRLDEEAVKLYARDLRASTRARAATLLHRTFLTRELAPILAGRYRRRQLRAPTLILSGERGPIRPRILATRPMPADELRFEVVPGAGHLLPEERPELVAERALEHFAASGAAVGEGGVSEPAAPR